MKRLLSVLVAVLVAACTHHAAQTTTTPPATQPVAATQPAAVQQPSGPPPLTIEKIAEGAQIIPDLGTWHRSITTTNKDAQAYFDQGLRLIYGFNHDEAARSFAKAALLDPTCASCFWGVALVLGPNYNMPMMPERFPAAWDALQKAQANAKGATPVEQALIGALAKRYPGPEPKDMQPFTVAYAAAMTDVAKQFPADDDVQVLRAEALMDVNPWKLWNPDGTPADGTNDIVSTLETVLKRTPNHPGANHYYIHAVEASPHPDRAVPEAERLSSLIPGAGHIVHMPAHIFQRVGRYADASAANRKAAAVDETYVPHAPDWGYYSMYLVHNYGFLAFSASMQGRSAESLDAAKKSAAAFPPPMLDMMPGMDFFVSEPLLVMVRFGKFDDILAMPPPPAKYATLTALYLHAHGLANASKGKLDDAAADLAQIRKLAETIPAEASTSTNSIRDLVNVSAAIVEAAIAQKKNDPKTLELWAAAVALEDKLAYSEPNDWFYPVRHYQGAALIAAKKFKDAEAVYRKDLEKNPGNGWSLFGLSQALHGEGKDKDAAAVEKDLAKAWPDADIKLTSSAFL
jgi:tetratricopeptide (TPR) repeat protein